MRYWPTAEEGQREFPTAMGTIKVIHVNERQNVSYILRELAVSREGCNEGTRQVFHYHFTVWPDHNVPKDPSCVLDLQQDVNSCQERILDAGPIVVHCSAGIGRTGTYIAIDMLINYIKQAGLDCEIDIQRTIKLLREQRSGMVQTEAQYTFVYKAVQHFIGTLTRRIQEVQVSDRSLETA